MSNFNLTIRNKNMKKTFIILFILFLSSFLSSNFLILKYVLNINFNNSIEYENDKNLNLSVATWASLNLTNPMINNTRHSRGSVITIEGRLYNAIPLPIGTPEVDYNIILVIDGIDHLNYSDTTDSNGEFQINFTIPYSSNIFYFMDIRAKVTNPDDPVDYLNTYHIYSRATSYFDVNSPSDAKLIGEIFDFDGDAYLRLLDGSAIPSSTIDYFWYDGAVIVDSNIVSTDTTGRIPPISIPDIGIADLDLKLTFQSPPEIGYSETLFTETKVFSNISCIWDLPSTIKALTNLTIAGRIVSKTDPTVAINDRLINIYYNGSLVRSDVQTGSNGEFSVPYFLHSDTGLTFITIRLQNNLAKNLVTRYLITVQPPQSTPIGNGPQAPPFLLFFSIFLPILGVVVGVLAFFGYRYYKKQDKLSKVVNLPLENKITNLKILKETGRIEESLSYLFNAIYVDLINAKFGRTRNSNETIRDFAIISVKELNLTPARIYPFIQKVEEIIYAKPFQITDKEFYSTIDLFSPIYFELTGYNFVLKF